MKTEEQQVIHINMPELIPVVSGLRAEGYRLVAITATTGNIKCELSYSFDKDYQVRTIRMTILKSDILPTITGSYPSAFVYETELYDLFAITVAKNPAIPRNTAPGKRISFPSMKTFPRGDNACQNR